LLNSKGVLLQDKNDFKEAEYYYLQALEIQETLSIEQPDLYLPILASSLHNLGILYRVKNQHLKSDSILNEALKIRRLLNKKEPTLFLKEDLIRTLQELGIVNEYLNNFSKSEEYYKEALVFYENLKSTSQDDLRPFLAMILTNYSNLLNRINDLDKAIKKYEEALSLYRQLSRENPKRYNPILALCLNQSLYGY